ncbi:MAG: hypothetical protein CME88_12585 [Hirschia sp.]|nr:hypothetical protein [Hirschia sp.]MBF19204.1 hypothetical protein [Hirschia sp.]|tara:strand:+ start:74 stop:568 length:495 start_codon:yes stop_codon:yes gene_type:complete
MYDPPDGKFIDLPLMVIALRLLGAVLLGCLIGLEREMRDHAAGLRTHMLTALAASTFVLIAVEMVNSFGADSDITQLDPLRTVEAATSGVAFLAAGTIIQARGQVKGLTTGASIWLSGAVGVACGAGYFYIAGLATLIALAILLPVSWIEAHWLNRRKDAKNSD